jgi:dynein heavy chain
LIEIKGSFAKLIEKFKANKKDKILDVKASNWHDEYNAFKSGVKELDVMYQNVIDFAFKQVTTV